MTESEHKTASSIDYSEANLSRDTPEGFVFLTNVGMTAEEDRFIAELEAQKGVGNVAVTRPAWDKSGVPWQGRAVHVRKETT